MVGKLAPADGHGPVARDDPPVTATAYARSRNRFAMG